MIKFLILLALVAWLGLKFKVFLSKIWLAFVEPALDRVGEKASDVIAKESGHGDVVELSKTQAEDLRQ